MSRILITGSAQGLGRNAATSLLEAATRIRDSRATQLKIQNRQHRLELGGLCINRFWSVDDELTMADPASEPERYKRLHIRYLKLCEDEFDAARWVGSIPSSGLNGMPSTLGPRYALSLNPLFATMATLLICALSKCASLRPLRSDPMMRRHARL